MNAYGCFNKILYLLGVGCQSSFHIYIFVTLPNTLIILPHGDILKRCRIVEECNIYPYKPHSYLSFRMCSICIQYAIKLL